MTDEQFKLHEMQNTALRSVINAVESLFTLTKWLAAGVLLACVLSITAHCATIYEPTRDMQEIGYTATGSFTPVAGPGLLLDLRNVPGDVRTVTLTFTRPVDSIGFWLANEVEGVGTGTYIPELGFISEPGVLINRFVGFTDINILAMTLETFGPVGNTLLEHEFLWGVVGTFAEEAPPQVVVVPEPSSAALALGFIALLALANWRDRRKR